MKKTILMLFLLAPLLAQDSVVVSIRSDYYRDLERHFYEIDEQLLSINSLLRERMVDPNVRKKMAKKQKIKSVVRLAVVAGVAYYVGYHEGEKHSKPMCRRFPMGGKK